MTTILDWFHISMKMDNIALQKTLKPKLLRIKWHLWRGNHAMAITRLKELSNLTDDASIKSNIEKFKNYVTNNIARIINYRERKKHHLVFISNLAEATVESLINRRCKGRQHMRWSRDGLNPILQLRAKIHTKEWADKWRSVVLHSIL